MVLIVGGGIAGLSLACCLAQRGIECELIEREPVWTTVGGGITLYPNGVRALGTFGLRDEVQSRGRLLDRIRMLTRDGRFVGEAPGEAWEGLGPTVLIDRRALQAVLRKASAAVQVRLGTTVTAIERVPDGVRVRFNDWTARRYDLVVGADGIRSSVGQLCFGDRAPTFVGQVYWRTAVEVDLVDCPTMMFDGDRYVVVFPLGNGASYLAWQLRLDEPFPDPVHGRRARLLHRFGDFGEPGAQALASLPDDQSLHFGVAEELANDRWQSDRVVLIGDAAHACSPTMAQGGSLAIEDAVVLAEELHNGEELAAALDRFVARRAPRVRWVRDRTHVEIEQLNQGASHLAERARVVKAVLSEPI